MEKIKICILYKTKEGPGGGGANRFHTALIDFLGRDERFEIVEDPYSDYDILFANQLSKGPGASTSDLVEDCRWQITDLEQMLQGSKKKLVVRAVNLLQEAYPIEAKKLINPINIYRLRKIKKLDNAVLKLIEMADVAIFQSEYQQRFFHRYGLKQTKQSFVIHNGASKEFRYKKDRRLQETIKFLASCASDRSSKRHDIIAKVSEFPNVQVFYAGKWPDTIPSKKVKLLGFISKREIVNLMDEVDFFLHPAIKDPCPNSVFEALAAGLPVFYNPGVGSGSELVRDCGVPINEKNLEESLARGIFEYPNFLKKICERHPYFLIDRAAFEYLEVFSKVMKE